MINSFTGREACTRCVYAGCPGGLLRHHLFVVDVAVSRFRKRYGLRALKRWWTALDYSQIEDVEVDGMDHRDAPDFCDAFIASATYRGRPMTDAELDRLNEDSSYVYECVQERLY